jgi:hypothetical protein
MARNKCAHPPCLCKPENGLYCGEICEEAAIGRWSDPCVCEHLKCQVTRADASLRLRSALTSTEPAGTEPASTEPWRYPRPTLRPKARYITSNMNSGKHETHGLRSPQKRTVLGHRTPSETGLSSLYVCQIGEKQPTSVFECDLIESRSHFDL